MSDAVLSTTPIDARVPSWRVRVWHAYLLVGVAAVAAYYRLPKAGWAQCILFSVLNLTAVVASVVAIWRTRGWQRVAWSSFAVAMLVSTLGNAAYFGYPLVKHQPLPFPSHVDTLLLAAFPFLAFGLVALGLAHGGRRWPASRIVTVVAAAAGCGVLWQQLVVPTQAVPLPDFAHKVSVAYPMLDVAVFAVLVWFVCRARRWNVSALWVVISFVVMIAGAAEFSSQVAANTYAYGGPTDALWMLNYLFVGVAALAAHASPSKGNS